MTPLPRLLFLHLDRSGGTSILRSLRTLYESQGQTFRRTDNPVFGEIDCYAGHFPFQRVFHFSDYLTATLLRDPVTREESWLNKCATPGPHSLEQKLRVRTAARDLDLYIDTFIYDGLYASRYTCGHCTLPNAFCVLHSLDLVGTTEHISAFHSKLGLLLNNSAMPPLEHANSALRVFTFTPDQRKRIASILKDDYEIYRYAQTL